MTPVRVLLVDDYEPFRRMIHALLESSTFRIVGEAADGLEAIHKATLLQPELILLDIALPRLNGIRAAEQIAKMASHSKILFLSQESSLEVIQQALNLGALGYLQKTRTHRELLSAVESVTAGRQFVSTGVDLGGFAGTTSAQISEGHEVEFYSEDHIFLAGVTDFVAQAMRAGNPAIVMATETHRQALVERLADSGIDIDAQIQRGTYVSLDAVEMLSKIMVGDSPDAARFFEGLSGLIRSASEAAGIRRPRVAICGECCGILCAGGNTNSAIQLEKIGNELVKTHTVEILCTYSLSAFPDRTQGDAFASICKEHSALRVR